MYVILGADRGFEARCEAGDVADNIVGGAAFLYCIGRQLFTKVVNYTMLKAGTRTALLTRIGRTSNTTKVSIRQLVMSRQCRPPCSVTIMTKGGVCGSCPPSKLGYQGRNIDKNEVFRTSVRRDQTEMHKAA